MGRTASGVKGIALKGADKVAAGVVVSANGYGKRTSIEHYPLRNRGGYGVINMSGLSGAVKGSDTPAAHRP